MKWKQYDDTLITGSYLIKKELNDDEGYYQVNDSWINDNKDHDNDKKWKGVIKKRVVEGRNKMNYRLSILKGESIFDGKMKERNEGRKEKEDWVKHKMWCIDDDYR